MVGDERSFDSLFLGVGAMKAGTTWLYSVLANHPDLYFTYEKEIHYFYHVYNNSDVLSTEKRVNRSISNYLRFHQSNTNAKQIRTRLHWTSNYLSDPVDEFWYRNLFVYRTGQKYPCDFSNLYALLPDGAWKSISSKIGNLKVLYTMRHPVKRLWSHFKFHLEFTGNADNLDNWQPTDYEELLRKPYFWDNAEYGRIVRRLRSELPERSLMLCFYEDLHSDQRRFLYRLEDFLEIRHFQYPATVIRKRVNESIKKEMPPFFPKLVEKDVARIIEELRCEGLQIPEEWTSQ